MNIPIQCKARHFIKVLGIFVDCRIDLSSTVGMIAENGHFQ